MSQKQRMTTEEIKAHVEEMFKQFDEVDGLADLVTRSTQSFGEGDSEMESAFFSDLQMRVARKIFGEGECDCARCAVGRALASKAGSTPIQ